MNQPTALIIGGPNGAGKSTLASTLIQASAVFLNADEIAKSLPADSEHRDIVAVRLFLDRLDMLVASRADFAIETTLASRSLAPRIRRWKAGGYDVRLAYVWIESPEFSIQRVAERVRLGGHLCRTRPFGDGITPDSGTSSISTHLWLICGTFMTIRANGDHAWSPAEALTLKQALKSRASGRSANGSRPAVKPMTLGEITSDEKYITEAFGRAVEKALQDHKRAGNPIAVWEDGQVKIIPPEEIPDVLED